MSLIDVRQFLDEHDTCVLATVNADGKPQSATVGFSIDENWGILIGTNKNTRKYKNLEHNPNVALTIGVVGSKTVQYEGIAKELTIEELGARLKEYFSKVPASKKFLDAEGQRYFIITPTWLRFTDYTAPEPIFETKDFA